VPAVQQAAQHAGTPILPRASRHARSSRRQSGAGTLSAGRQKNRAAGGWGAAGGASGWLTPILPSCGS